MKFHSIYLVLAASVLIGTSCNSSILQSPTPTETPIPTATTVGNSSGRFAYSAEYNGNRDVYTINIDGTSETRLTTSPDWDWSPNWSPDGSQIAFLSYRNGNTEIYIMSADGSKQTRLTKSTAFEGYPTWSPDGKNLAFVSDEEEPDPANCGNKPEGCINQIYIMDMESSNVTQLTNDPSNNESPSWSPDGTQLVFHSDKDGTFDIYIINSDGSNPKRLTSDLAISWRPAWSPLGKKIAFMSDRNNDHFEIYIMDTDGSNVIQLTKGNANNSAPSWSPDGKLIAFQSSLNGVDSICTIDINGENMNCLGNETTTAWEPKWQPSIAVANVLPKNHATSTKPSMPTSTSIPQSTNTPRPTPLPKEIKLKINAEAMAIVSSWESTIQAFTSASKPVNSLDGLTSEEVGFWNNSKLGFDLYDNVSKLFEAFGNPLNGLYGCPDAENAFSECSSIRIFFVDSSITEVKGGIKVIFEQDDSAAPPAPSDWNGIPIMPQAMEGKEEFGDYQFTTSVPVADIMNYYQQEMPSLGWEIVPDMMTSIPTDLAFTKGNTYVFFKIFVQGNSSLVLIHIVQM